jgi:hypothetical protein
VLKGKGKELVSGLILIFKENKIDLDPDHLYAEFNFTHPTLLERVRLITDKIN